MHRRNRSDSEVGTLAKIRRLYFRDKQSIKEICRQTGLSRNTVRTWLREPEMMEPKYPVRLVVSKLDAYADTLRLWLKADAGRGKRERRTKGQMWQALREMGYAGSYGRVCAFARQWKQSQGQASTKAAFIPLKFKPGEAFQFGWSTEYTFIGGLRRRVRFRPGCAACWRLRWASICLASAPSRARGRFRAWSGWRRSGKRTMTLQIK